MPSLPPISTDPPPPRARRPSRPLPFTSTAPTLPPHHSQAPIPTTPDRERSYFPPSAVADPKVNGHSGGSSRRGMGRGWQREVAVELHGCLYGGEREGRTGEEVREFVEENYANEAVFENPLVTAKGPGAIADLFCLTGVLGGIYSELNEIAESMSYDGHMLLILTHTIHLSFLPAWLGGGAHPPPLSTSLPRTPSLHRSHSTYSFAPSSPTTPHQDYYSTSTSPTTPSFPLTARTLPAPAPPPSSGWLPSLSPLPLLASLTTFQLKLHTRLVFDHDQVISHEDTWGIREVVESMPLVGAVYGLNRRAVAGVAGMASRAMFGDKGRQGKGGPGGEEESGVGVAVNGRGVRAYDYGVNGRSGTAAGVVQEDVFGRVRGASGE